MPIDSETETELKKQLEQMKHPQGHMQYYRLFVSIKTEMQA